MEVVLKFARVNPWAGIAKYKNCYDYIGTYWTRAGNIHTGLSEEDARRLEKAIGYPEGHLAPYSSFWATYSIKLGNKDLYIHTEKPEDELKYLFLKNHKRVAFGTSNITPSTDYLLSNSQAEAEENNKKFKVKREAYSAFTKMSLEEMRKCLRLFGVSADTMSNELVESTLFSLVDKQPQNFFTKWVNNKTKETEFLIESAIAKGIIRKDRTQYYYGSEMLADSLQDCIAYLDAKKNQDLKISIINQIENK